MWVIRWRKAGRRGRGWRKGEVEGKGIDGNSFRQTFFEW